MLQWYCNVEGIVNHWYPECINKNKEGDIKHNTQNYWIFGLCPLSSILKTFSTKNSQNIVSGSLSIYS
jgi:hypothetical protein